MIALVFPGQGSQAAGMAADVAQAVPAARRLFEQADRILGFELSRLCFEGPDEQLKQTEVAQPALLTASLALYEAVRETLDEVALVAGHSLGEYTALVATGVLDFETALRLVRQRGELMSQAAAAQPGAMAAVLNLDDEDVARLCDDAAGIVVPANYNAPGQVVISGDPEAVSAVAAQAKAAGGRAIPLKVSGAFHSPLMTPAVAPMTEALEAAEFLDAKVPVVSNVTAQPTTAAAELRRNLVDQVTGSVRWTESVRAMRAAGAWMVVEVGPGNVLTGLAKRIEPELASYNVNTAAAAEGLRGWLESGASRG